MLLGSSVSMNTEESNTLPPLICSMTCWMATMLRQKTMPMQRADHGAGDADERAAHQEDAQHRAGRGAQRAQHRDVAALVLHQHDQRRDHVERGHQHDHAKHDEHGVLLHLQHADDGVVGVAPVAQQQRAPVQDLRAARAAASATRSGSVDTDLDAGDRIRLLEEDLRRAQRQEHHTGIVVVQTGIEDRHHLVGAHARDGAERGRRALRRDHRQRITDAQAIQLGQADTDGDRVVAGELVRVCRRRYCG